MPTKKNAPASGKLGGRRKKGPAGGRGTPDQGDTPTLPGLQAKEEPMGKPEQVTWLTPTFNVWVARFGVKPTATAKLMARVLKPLVDEYGNDVVAPAFAAYLADVEARFVSVQKFADTFPEWMRQTAVAGERWTPTWEE